MKTGAAVIQEDQRVVVRPAGDVVAASVPGLQSVLREFAGKGAREVVIDLVNAEMVDSTGIGLLIWAHSSLGRRGGKLTVIHASGEILDLFRAMRIDQHFAVSGD